MSAKIQDFFISVIKNNIFNVPLQNISEQEVVNKCPNSPYYLLSVLQ
ncbi:hypothetical protein CAPGI0001_0296 [Capnocytophaga gingivalis ATCC 33624]|nr:hypothetical protein CAPGI0001_0296 [Capnocytophaga gingivalis ATCC 33624]